MEMKVTERLVWQPAYWRAVFVKVCWQADRDGLAALFASSWGTALEYIMWAYAETRPDEEVEWEVTPDDLEADAAHIVDLMWEAWDACDGDYEGWVDVRAVIEWVIDALGGEQVIVNKFLMANGGH